MSLTAVILIIVAVIAAVLVVLFLLFGRGEGRFTFDIGGAAPRAEGGTDTSSDTGFKERLTGLGVFAVGVIGVLTARLWSMQLVSSDDYTKQAETNRTRTVTTSAPRGRILDRNGVELVTNRSSLTVTADSEVADNPFECQLLANIIGMPAAAVRRNIQNASEGAQSTRVVASDVSRRVVAFIEERPYLFDGVTVEERAVRFYPQGSLAAHVLGYVGTITSEQLESEAGDSESSMDYQSGDTVGQAGIEYQYETVLQGVRGEQNVYVDADGNVLDYGSGVDPQAGSDLQLTIDSKIQKAAEESLSSTIQKLQETSNKDCKCGSVVCLDVTSGDVIAMASMPTYSPNTFVGGISASDWEEISGEDSQNPLLNRAISGQYPSASTIKPLTTMAALDAGIATAQSSYVCTGYWTGFGKAYGQYCWNHSGHGTMNLQSGITFSCDVVFYEIGKAFFEAGSEGMQETFRTWGLGSKEGVDLPSELAGRVPDKDWKWNYFTWADDDARSWQGGDNTNLAIGQGDLLVTPLQMACAYAGIANNGTVYKPHLLKSVLSQSGTGSIIKHKKEKLREVDEKQEYLDLVKAGLHGVIYEESESQASHFTNMSVEVAGKTGTAEIANAPAANGWFVAYAPADDPKYVVASCIEGGGYGSTSAMYVVRDVLGALYDEPDTSSEVSQGDR
ncbi:MAG: penicillin-binding protein 2 [Olegusella sp.]|nr:penicillin-binding protein 2 [Olegusella sp.]